MRCLPSLLSLHEWKFEKERDDVLRGTREILLVKLMLKFEIFINTYQDTFHLTVLLGFYSYPNTFQVYFYYIAFIYCFISKRNLPHQAGSFPPPATSLNKAKETFLTSQISLDYVCKFLCTFFCGFNFHIKLTIFN